MHEWLSMALLLPFVLHVWRNWTPILNYSKRSALWAPVTLSLVAAAAFATPAALGGGGGSPMTAARLVLHAPLAEVAPLFKTDAAGLRAALAANGYKGAGDTLESVAEASHASPFAMIAAPAPR